VGEVNIGLVGKYVEYEDSYKSLKEALLHGGLAHRLKVNIHWIEAEGVVGDGWESQMEGYDGILVPGGFGKRGIEGMLNAIRYARERKVPYFGICLGMQTMVIEFARQRLRARKGRFHRVRPRHAAPRDLQAAGIEGYRRVGRHHAAGRVALQAGGGQLRPQGLRNARDQRAPPPPLRVQPRIRGTADRRRPAHHGETPDQTYVEICEIPDHPWFLGCQFHPEFKSKPLEPHPLFVAFIGAANENRQKRAAAPGAREPQYSRGD
jgi:CTP synthase